MPTWYISFTRYTRKCLTLLQEPATYERAFPPQSRPAKSRLLEIALASLVSAPRIYDRQRDPKQRPITVTSTRGTAAHQANRVPNIPALVNSRAPLTPPNPVYPQAANLVAPQRQIRDLFQSPPLYETMERKRYQILATILRVFSILKGLKRSPYPACPRSTMRDTAQTHLIIDEK